MQAGGGSGGPILGCIFVFFVFCVFCIFDCGFQTSGGSSFLFLVKFQVECRHNHVWGPPGARVMSIFVKAFILKEIVLGDNHS